MSRRSQLLMIIVAVAAITSLVSHIAVRALHIRVDAVQQLDFGNTNLPVHGIAVGSSLMFYGLDWSGVARDTGMHVQGWAVPSGSVVEMEVLKRNVPTPQYTFLGFGISDINDNYVSDYRAEIVPLGKAIAGLWEAHVDWSFARRVLSQYPLKYLRAIFPTAGRSMHVMVGVRAELKKLLKRGQAQPSEQAVISSESNTHQESISDWPEARKLRNIALNRDSSAGSFTFRGPKRDALLRFLKDGAVTGKVVVVVFPESLVYEKAFVTAEVKRQFHAMLDEAQKQTPEALWLRLDLMPELRSDAFYWDLVHLNAPGQARATEALRKHLAASGIP